MQDDLNLIWVCVLFLLSSKVAHISFLFSFRKVREFVEAFAPIMLHMLTKFLLFTFSFIITACFLHPLFRLVPVQLITLMFFPLLLCLLAIRSDSPEE